MAKGQPITIRTLRLTSLWSDIQAALQIWVTNVSRVLTQGVKIIDNCFADVVTIDFTVTSDPTMGGGFTVDYPFGIQLPQKVTVGPPLGVTVLGIHDRTHHGYDLGATSIVFYPPETPALTVGWNNHTGTLYCLDISPTSRPRVVGHSYTVVVRIDGT